MLSSGAIQTNIFSDLRTYEVKKCKNHGAAENTYLIFQTLKHNSISSETVPLMLNHILQSECSTLEVNREWSFTFYFTYIYGYRFLHIKILEDAVGAGTQHLSKEQFGVLYSFNSGFKIFFFV